MNSKRRHEGYLQIDHRAGFGLTSEEARAAGPTAIPVRAGGMLESATVTCSHCQTIVVLNPDRSRSRGYCPKCDHYICDTCEAARVTTGICRPFKQIVDETLEAAVKANP